MWLMWIRFSSASAYMRTIRMNRIRMAFLNFILSLWSTCLVWHLEPHTLERGNNMVWQVPHTYDWQQYGEDGWHARWQDLVMLSVMSVHLLVWWLCQAMQSEVATQWIADIYVLCQQLMIWFNMDCREGFRTIAERRYGSTWQVVTKAPMICFAVCYCMYTLGVVLYVFVWCGNVSHTYCLYCSIVRHRV